MGEFSCKTHIISGAGALAQIKKLKPERFFIVSDPFFAENGTAEKLSSLSGAAETKVFSKVKPDPSVELVAEGALELQAFAPDTVAAMGGGSAMDCAKAMVHFSGVQARLVAIPTTSGSGSEVTDFAVLTHNEGKYPLVDAALRPDVAILDSDLLEKLPKPLIADTGFDVLAHALEGYVATKGDGFSEALGAKAFCMAMENLLPSYKGDLSAREKMHEAATMAGLCFTHAGLGLCHAVSHALGGALHLPHGRLNAILLPAVVRCNTEDCRDNYAKLARLAGIPGVSDTIAARNLKTALCRLRKELGLPKSLQEAGVSARDLDEVRDLVIKTACADPCCATNPVPVTDALVRAVLKEVQSGE